MFKPPAPAARIPAAAPPADGVYALCELLRERVRSGHYSADGRLPDEHALVQELGVSRTRLRAAMDILKEEGVVVRLRGHGTYASWSRVRYRPHSATGIAATLAASDLSVTHQVLSAATWAMDPLSASEFGVDPGTPLHAIERITSLGGEPLSFSAYVVRGDLAPAMLRPEYRDRGLDMRDWLNACSVSRLAHVDVFIEAVAADAHVAQHLDCPEGLPLLRLNRRFSTVDGEVISHGSASTRGDRFSYQVAPKTLDTYQLPTER